MTTPTPLTTRGTDLGTQIAIAIVLLAIFFPKALVGILLVLSGIRMWLGGL